MDWCDVCKYNPPDYSSHEPDKPCGDCWVFGEGNEPSKFVETENRQTNADRIRSMTDEELALWLAKFTDCSECPISAYPHCTTSDEACACGWHEWLKEEVSE